MKFDEIQQELKRNNLAVFPAIREKAASIGHWEITEEVENLWNTYQQMLQFMLNGVNDPQSEQIREKVCRSLQIAASRLERQERLKNNASEKYVSSRKELKNVPSFESLVNQLETVSSDITRLQNDELVRESVRQRGLEELEKTHEMVLINLFNWTWTSDIWQNSDTDQASRLMFSDTISNNDKAVFVSAVTLALFEFVDINKTLFLLDCYLIEDEQISQRSLVGFVLIFVLLFDKLNGSKDLLDRLHILRDDATFIHDFYSTMMQLQLSCTTDSVTSKMRNDIIPTIMQGQMRHSGKKKLDLRELTKNGENPEWIDNALVDKKMHEMAELQLDGADIYFSSFSMLKGYPFFGKMPHWFYPFSFNAMLVPDIKQVLSGRIGRLMKLILNSSPFCNSDKFSLCFTFKTLGSIGEATIEAQINQQLDGENIDEILSDAESTHPKKSDIRRQYIFDLYRFFHSYPYRQQFVNPFTILKKNPITPYSNAWLTMLLGEDKEDMTLYADFLMRKEFYTAAIQLFENLPKNEFEAQYASLWQKIGFCQQKLSRPSQAIHAYSTANSLKPNSKWTLSHLAALCLSEGKQQASSTMMEQAAQLYTQLLDIEPDNQRYLLNAAQSLMNIEQFGEAQQHLYKAFYLDEDSPKTKLMLGWCLIASNQTDKATNYLLDVLIQNPLNAEALTLQALIMLVEGRNRDAYNHLQMATSEGKTDSAIEKLSTLAHLGILNPNTVQLFTDALTLHID